MLLTRANPCIHPHKDVYCYLYPLLNTDSALHRLIKLVRWGERDSKSIITFFITDLHLEGSAQPGAIYTQCPG